MMEKKVQMLLLDALGEAAEERDLVLACRDAATVFALVRDMPYKRAGNRESLTIIREWRGTCSGKHYLLKALFSELGYASTLMACTYFIPPVLSQLLPEEAQARLLS